MKLTKEQKEYAKKKGYSEEQMKMLVDRYNSETGAISGKGTGISLADFMKKNKKNK